MVKALVVDDSMVSRRILFGILQHSCDIEDVEQVSDGEEALELIKEEDFDLILLDWNMPNMQGIDVLREIRAMGMKTPVIMVTGESDKEHVVEAYEAGATNYIIKPFGPETVAKKIKEVLEKTRDSSKRRRKVSALIVDDSATILKILAGILKDRCGFEEVIKASNGNEAVDAVDHWDFDLILLDWNMPEMSGIDALRVIRGKGKKCPIVMVTSEKEGTRVVEAFDAGADNYIIKPFEPTALTEKVKQVMHIHN